MHTLSCSRLVVRVTLFLCAALFISQASAAQLESFMPQGEVRTATGQAVAVFDSDMAVLGSEGVVPFAVDCPMKGSGKWVDTRTWVYSLQRPLADGERCDFTKRNDLKNLAGETVYGESVFQFFTAAPWVKRSEPTSGSSYTKIEEDQVFFLTTSAAVRPESVEQHGWCEVAGIGERIALKVLPAEEYNRINVELGRKFVDDSIAVTCARRLPPSARVVVVWGAGIVSEQGTVTRSEQRLEYTVRAPFAARLSCDRPRPQAPCSPFSDIRVELTSSIALPSAAGDPTLTVVSGGRSKTHLPEKQKEEATGYVFKGPFPANAELDVGMPKDLQDLSGRTLANIDRFPVKMKTGPFPALVKFAADFGILERGEGGILPVTVRAVEKTLPMSLLEAGARMENRATHLWTVSDEEAQRLLTDLYLFRQKTKPGAEDADEGDDGDEEVKSDFNYPYRHSFLNGRPGVVQRELPKPGSETDFEVIGIPLEKPGLYIVELESRLLGTSLLDENAPAYVRSAALVTNLAVHFKSGSENALIWVTRLNDAQPVAGATTQVYDCAGKMLWQGNTDDQGLARINQRLAQPGNCKRDAFFVSAKIDDDYSFAYSDWNKGIDRWRYNLPYFPSLPEDIRVHSVLDRTLLRAGETLSMKHIARRVSGNGFDYPDRARLPATVTLRRIGDEEEIELPLVWDERGVATNTWAIPKTAKLGGYEVVFTLKGTGDDDEDYFNQEVSATFQVGEFRLPVFSGQIDSGSAPLVGNREIPLELQLAFLNGGPASNLTVQLSGMVDDTDLSFPAFDDYRFGLSFDARKRFLQPASADGEADMPTPQSTALIVDAQTVKLDAHGIGKTSVVLPQPTVAPQTLLAEMSFSDPNGSIQTISRYVKLWPAAVIPGLKAHNWDEMRTGKLKIDTIVLDLDGQPVAGAPVTVRGILSIETAHRKRVAGGFYAYQRHEERKDLGVLCEGRSDKAGRFVCEGGRKLTDDGKVIAIVEARDKEGRVGRSDSTFWIYGEEDRWYSGEDHDRIDVLPEKWSYQPGETARFEVRTPFREATALISVEREGVIDTFVQPLQRHKPFIEVPIKFSYGPNVYVSVLLVRGRLTQLPWNSLFSWGWREPWQWFKEWWTLPRPTAVVDLARPAFKLGIVNVDVGRSGYVLDVAVKPEKTEYKVRDKAKVAITVKQPDGTPLPQGSEVAVAAVDQALLELSSNKTWNLLDAFLQYRSYRVDTATAQLQVVGKRHFGKKALPAGGGGGRAPLRELFDTLLYWNPRVSLDQSGQALVEIPLNDSLTEFQIVAIAEAGANRFGTGSARIRSTQDLQLISGLPPLVREHDRYRATVTIRNAGSRPLSLQVGASMGTQSLEAQTLDIAAGEADEVAWQVEVPAGLDRLEWNVLAQEKDGALADRFRVVQQIVPAVPETVRVSSLVRLEGGGAVTTVPVQRPAGSLPGRGGIGITLSSRLAGNRGLVDYFERYPYTCFEQRLARAVVLGDQKLWSDIISTSLAAYIDRQGFVRFFPGNGNGDVVLTAYLLQTTKAAGHELPGEFSQELLSALAGYLEGKISLREPESGERKLEKRLMALAALARYHKAEGRHFTLFDIDPVKLSSAALVDWYQALLLTTSAPGRDAKLDEAKKALHNRFSTAGGRLVFADEAQNGGWWRLENANATAFRLIELVAGNLEWQDEMPRLVQGMLLRQRNGHWGMTSANAWASLALNKFSRHFEKEAVSGATEMRLVASGVEQKRSYGWPAFVEPTDGEEHSVIEPMGRIVLPWSERVEETLDLQHQGKGQPWAQVEVIAAVPVQSAVENGFTVRRSVVAVEQKVKGSVSRGDIYRVRIDIDSAQEINWVVVNDPIPGGSTILGDGGRDSAQAIEGENRDAVDGIVPAYVERGLAGYRAYFSAVPKGRFGIEYTLRINNAGEFSLPPTRVEALYAPDVFAEIPNEKVTVTF